MRSVRATLAGLLWWGGVLVAAGYAFAVCLVGLEAPAQRAWVETVYRLADAGGGGVLDRDGLLAEEVGAATPLRIALSSWGVASGAWLVLGWVASWLVAPRRSRG